MRYIVIIADNYHYMDKDSEYTHGEYATYEEAEKVCKRLVDECLAHGHTPGQTVDECCTAYVMFGCDPYIVPVGGKDSRMFSARDYARGRYEAICMADHAEA